MERLELLAAGLVAGEIRPIRPGRRLGAVLGEIETSVRPKCRGLRHAGDRPALKALDGPLRRSGPVRRPDPRAASTCCPRAAISIPSTTARCRRPPPGPWARNRPRELLVERHLPGQWKLAPLGRPLRPGARPICAPAVTTLRKALALIGAKPKWDPSSWRVTGFEIIPLAKLGRPRVDVTLRISGFFRDAFPAQIDLFDSAVRAVGALDEDERDNPIAARIRDRGRRASGPGSRPRRKRSASPGSACSAPSPAPMARGFRR